MLKIHNRSQLHHIIDTDIHKLVTLRRVQMDSNLPTPMVIMESVDSLSDIENEIGFSILTNLFDDITYPNPDFVPSCEALEDHGVLMDEGSSWRTATDLISRLDT